MKNSDKKQTNEYGIAKKSFQNIRAQVKTHKYKQSSQDLWNQLSFVDTELKKHEQVQQSQKSQRMLNQKTSSHSIYKFSRNKQSALTDRTKQQKRGDVSFEAKNQSQNQIKTNLKSISKQSILNRQSPLKNYNKQIKAKESRQIPVKTVMFERNTGNQKKPKRTENKTDRVKMRQSTELLQRTTEAFQYFSKLYADDQIKGKKVNKIFKDLILMIQI